MGARMKTHRPNGEPYPADILFLAEFYELDPEYVLKHPHDYIPRTGGVAPGADIHLDPERFAE